MGSVVNLAAFGPWDVAADGRTTGELQSRVGRELLLRMSIASGPVTRERLVDELWPDQVDVLRGRRRLTQELSRIRRIVGVEIWASTRQNIDVAPGCALASDLGTLLAGGRADAALLDPTAELDRLKGLLLLTRRGALLPTHESPLVLSLRRQAEQAEVRLIQCLLDLLGSRDPALGLSAARRWADLEPFADQAHRSVALRLASLHGQGVAERYVDTVVANYLTELGHDPSRELRFDVDHPHISPSYGGATPDRPIEAMPRSANVTQNAIDRKRHLLDTDDGLRLAGRNSQRLVGLDELDRLGHDAIDMARRRAEVAVADGDADAIATIVAQCPPLNAQSEAAARLLVLDGQRTEMLGEYAEAMDLISGVMAETTSPLVRMEGNLLLGRLLDATDQPAAAEAALLDVCADAEELGFPWYRAQALCTLGWVRSITGHSNKARQYLDQARSESVRIGAVSVEAAAVGALGHLQFREHRYGSSLTSLEIAGRLSEQIGDVRSHLRWRANAAVAAFFIGDWAAGQHHHDVVMSISRETGTPPPYWLAAVRCDLLGLELAPDEHSDAVRNEIASAQAKGLRNLEASMQVELVWRLIDAARYGEACRVASQLVTLCQTRPEASSWAGLAELSLGAALIVSDRPDEAMVHLRRASNTGDNGYNYPHILYYWHHAAAVALGELAEARMVAAAAALHARAVRNDLTEAQWQQAVANVVDFRRLAEMVSPAGASTSQERGRQQPV